MDLNFSTFEEKRKNRKGTSMYIKCLVRFPKGAGGGGFT